MSWNDWNSDVKRVGMGWVGVTSVREGPGRTGQMRGSGYRGISASNSSYIQ